LTIQAHLTRLVLASLLPAAVAAFLLIGYSYERHRESIKEHTLATARALTQAVDRDLASSLTALQALATSPSLASGDLAAFHAQARRALPELPGSTIVLSDSSGQQVLNTLRAFGEPLPLNGNLPQLKRVFQTGEPLVSDLFTGEVTRQPVIAVDVPVRRDGKIVYVLSMGFFADRLAEILKRQHIPDEWIGGIYDSHGKAAARTRSPEVYVGKLAGSVLLRNILEQRTEGEFETETLEGIPVNTVFSRSAVSNWTVAIAIPRAEFESQLRASLLWIVVGTVVLLALGSTLAKMLAGRIRTSIRGLIPPAEALARGETVNVPPLELAEAAEVANALEGASKVLRDREEILAVVTHDLRTPLNVLTMLATVAQQDARKLDSERLRTSTELMSETARRMCGLVDDLLAITVAHRGRNMMKLTRINAADVLAKAVQAARLPIEHAGLKLEVSAADELPNIRVDVDRIVRVFSNLLDNALKFSEPQGRVVLTAEALSNGVRFSIANSGPALPKGQLDDMFQRFWQAQADRRGSGLGLSISRAIIDTHGGRIWAQPQEGMRVRVCIELPGDSGLMPASKAAELQKA
jgi:signal transduction histidine kinase